MNTSILEGDAESAHKDADEILCYILEEEGYIELVKLFNSMDKRYA